MLLTDCCSLFRMHKTVRTQILKISITTFATQSHCFKKPWLYIYIERELDFEQDFISDFHRKVFKNLITQNALEHFSLKVPKCEIFDPFFYTNKSYMGRRLEAWINFCFFSKTMADIRHFVFFAHAEPALKNCLRRLSLR